MNDPIASDEPDPALISSEPAPMALEQAGIPMMITRRQRAALALLGVSDEAIRTMTPAEAHARLADGAIAV